MNSNDWNSANKTRIIEPVVLGGTVLSAELEQHLKVLNMLPWCGLHSKTVWFMLQFPIEV